MISITYEQLFDIQDEYEVTELICTTMSFEIDEQIKILGCMMKKAEMKRVNENFSGTQNALLSEVTAVINKCYFFYDKERTDFKLDKADNYAGLYTALLAMHCPVKAENGVFHPKIILCRYENKNKKVFYKLLVSSRNLTCLHSFEVGVQLTGEHNSDPNDKPNHNLCELVKWLAERVSDKEKSDRLKERAKELESFSFKAPGKEPKDILIRVSGIDLGQGQQDEELVDQWEKENKSGKSGKKELYILSPDYETDKHQIEEYHNIYYPTQMDENSCDQGKTTDQNEDKGVNTHAKLYYFPGKETVWLGSCNSSEAAMKGKNIECMVRIRGIKDDLIKADDEFLWVFERKCMRYLKGIDNKCDKYKLCKQLSEILDNCEIKGKDERSKDGKRLANISIRSIKLEEGYRLELLPLGMHEKDNKDESKWQEYRCGKDTYIFRGSKAEKPNGLLRVRLTYENNSAEKQEFFYKGIIDSCINRSSDEIWRGMVNERWLDSLMQVNTPKAIKEIKDDFMSLYNLAKELDLEEEKMNELENMKKLFRCFLSKKEKK